MILAEISEHRFYPSQEPCDDYHRRLLINWEPSGTQKHIKKGSILVFMNL